MYFDEPGWPLIDDFFAELAFGRTATTVRRYVRVHQRLVSFLDTGDMTLGLGDERAGLLDAEREFHESGAFWTLYGSAELVECLPSFLHQAWLPAGITESRMQVSVAARLLDHLVRQGLIDGFIPRDVLAGVCLSIDRARREVELRATKGIGGSPTMPARFLQQPGAEW